MNPRSLEKSRSHGHRKNQSLDLLGYEYSNRYDLKNNEFSINLVMECGLRNFKLRGTRLA